MAARTIGLALAICGVGCSSAAPSRPAVVRSDRPGPRVYVDTPYTGSDAERSARQQSVADVRAALGKAHGRLVLVDSPTEADITVAIIERVTADSGSSFSLFPPRYYAARSIVRLRATVTRAGESADLTGSRWRESDAQGWLSAAQDIATAIEAWIRASVSSPRQGPPREFCSLADRTPMGLEDRRVGPPSRPCRKSPRVTRVDASGAAPEAV